MSETGGQDRGENKANCTGSLKFQVGGVKGRPRVAHLVENALRRHYKPHRIVQNKANFGRAA